MEGRRFRRVVMNRAALRFPFPERFAERLTGAAVAALERRGKYLVARLSTGESLIMHLGMSGRFTVDGPGVHAEKANGAFYFAAPPDPRHDHVVFELEGNEGRRRIVYNDPRRFGFMDIESADVSASRHFRDMGPEPLSGAFGAVSLNACLTGRKTPIKAALLDQRVVAGVGNIYACEALFRAGVSPRRQAASGAGRRGERLAAAIQGVLGEAIEAGGSSLKDFAHSNGAMGYFQHRFDVYDREGEPGRVCGGTVSRITQAARSTFFCGRCQR